MIRRKRVHRGFPRTIASFRNLQGGPYGDMTLTAVSRDRMDIQIGDCYVIFSRKHVEDLRDAAQRFLDYKSLTDEEVLNLDETEIVTRHAVTEELVVAEHEKEVTHRTKRARSAS